PTDIASLTRFRAIEERGIVAIARVGCYMAEGDTPAAGSINQHESELRLGLKGDLSGDMGVLPPLGILRPAVWEKEASRHRPMERGAGGRFIGDILGTDHHLAVGDLAQCSTVLWLHPHGALPLLGETGVIEHQDAVTW